MVQAQKRSFSVRNQVADEQRLVYLTRKWEFLNAESIAEQR